MKTLTILKSYLLNLFLLAVLSIGLSCSSKSKSTLVWVNSMKSVCTDKEGELNCLSIHRGDSIVDPNWEIIASEIEGFDFEPGYFQKIEIKEELVNNDSSSEESAVKYTFVNRLEKIFDKRFTLNDIWVPNRILGNDINDSVPLPRMEINLSKMQLLGTNGCNNYRGKIERITSTEIEFGRIMSTKKMCLHLEITNQYDKALNSSKSYKQKEGELTFFDSDGVETLNFKKVD